MVTDFHPKAALWFLIILVLIGFAAAATYLGRESREQAKVAQSENGSSDSERQTRVYTVYYDFGVFSPTNIRIHAGDSVKFQNDSKTAIRIASDIINGSPTLPGFDSGSDIPAGSAFSFTFTKEGIFGYFNVKNPSEEGSVIVRP